MNRHLKCFSKFNLLKLFGKGCAGFFNLFLLFTKSLLQSAQLLLKLGLKQKINYYATSKCNCTVSIAIMPETSCHELNSAKSINLE